MASAVAASSTAIRRCARCHGPMFRDDDDVHVAFLCLLCGEYEFPSPPRRRLVAPSPDSVRRPAVGPPPTPAWPRPRETPRGQAPSCSASQSAVRGRSL